MPRRPRIDAAALSHLAPLGVARVAQLVALGLSAETIALRVRSGRWQRPFPGIVLMRPGPPSREQQIRAAALYAGRQAVLSGVEACRHHGLRRVPEHAYLHLLIPAVRRRRSCPGLVVERTAHLPSPVPKGNTLVAPLDRAVTDTARRTPGRDEVRAVVAEAVQQRRTTVERLTAELDGGNQRGSGLVREVLAEVADGIRSAAEGWGRDLHARSGLPPMLWNPSLYLPDRRFLARPDGYLPCVGMAWEQDSLEFHPPEEDDTARRRADMIGAGVVVAHHRPRRLLTEPERVLDELWAYYRLAAARPTPILSVVRAR